MTCQNSSAVEKVPQFLRLSFHDTSSGFVFGLSNHKTHLRWRGNPAIDGGVALVIVTIVFLDVVSVVVSAVDAIAHEWASEFLVQVRYRNI